MQCSEQISMKLKYVSIVFMKPNLPQAKISKSKRHSVFRYISKVLFNIQCLLEILWIKADSMVFIRHNNMHASYNDFTCFIT